MEGLLLAVLSFVGSHELLSHPLRRPLVARLGEKGFLGVYSLIAFATFGWVLWEYGRAPDMLLWAAPSWAWAVGAVLMLVASVLFVGSFVRNPALPGAKLDAAPRGVMRITRHPMMWSFAIWALVHAWLSGMAATMILCLGIGALALIGAAMQDRKKAGLHGEAWAAYAGATSYAPFGRGFAFPGWFALIGGTIFFLLATWAHPRMGTPVVGIWSWL
jgi:uncharacterized membrane protein